ncbi:MAG: HAD family hydrolase [Planctomycetota bacterium]
MADRSAHNYDLLAIDLDGTFLGPGSSVLDENVAAVRRAREAGLKVVFCTGRGLAESGFAFEACGLEHADPVVVAGGALVSDPRDGATLHRFEMSKSLVDEACVKLNRLGHPAMVLKDRAAAGYDYLVVQGDGLSLDPVTEWWFAQLDVLVRFARDTEKDEHPEFTVRVGACARAQTLEPVQSMLRALLGDRALMQQFKAVVQAEHEADGGEEVHILEIFDARAHKWGALEWVLDREGISAERVCAIGDEINDLTMLQHAGMGVAMGNAIDELRLVADRLCEPNHERGVARTIDRVLDGEW